MTITTVNEKIILDGEDERYIILYHPKKGHNIDEIDAAKLGVVKNLTMKNFTFLPLDTNKVQATIRLLYWLWTGKVH